MAATRRYDFQDGCRELIQQFAPRTVIPKPEADGVFEVKGWGKRRGERALVYRIPNNKGGRAYEKGITESELRASYQQLQDAGNLTCEWFRQHLPNCYAEGGCNFTTVGGLFELAGAARRGDRGEYVKTARAAARS